MEEWMSKYTLYRRIHSFISDNPDFIYMDMDTFCKSKDWNLIPFGEAEFQFLIGIINQMTKLGGWVIA